MAKVRFIGGGETCRVFGHTFVRTKWVDTDGLDEIHVARLATNPTFELRADTLAPKAVKAKA